jgi:hypothetical protein
MRSRGLELVLPSADHPPSPDIIALKPFFATSAGSSFSAVPTLVSSISARRKNSASARMSAERQIMPMPLAARARFHRSASTSAPPGIWHGRQSAGGQRQTHLAFGPTQVGEVKRDKSTKSRLDICEKEIRPVEGMPALRRDGRAQGLACAAVGAWTPARQRDELIDKSCNNHRRIVGCVLSGARRIHPVIVGWSTANLPLLPKPINDNP